MPVREAGESVEASATAAAPTSTDRTEHAGAEQAEYISPSLVRLCGKPAAAPAAPPLVIAHSVVGDEQGYERWYKPSNVLEREVIALRHPAFWSGVVEGSTSIQQLSEAYAAELVAYLADSPFDLIGGSLGALVAHRVALIARNLGGRPRGLVLIDPPESGAMPGFLRELSRHVHISFAMAAESLIIGPTIQLGGARDAGGLEALQGILDEVRGSPEGALAFVLAKASLPASPSIAQAQEATRAAAVRIAVHKQLIQLVWDEWGGRAPKPPRPFAFAGERGEPAILMVRASERGAYFSFLMTQGLRNVDDAVVDRLTGGRSAMVRAAFAKYENASDFRKMLDEGSSLAHIRDDFERVLGARALGALERMVQIQGSLGEFGASALELELEGQHFDVVMQCIARRDERFKAMAAEFLAPSPPAKALEELPRSRSTRAAATSGGGGSLKADGWQGALAELLAGVRGCLQPAVPARQRLEGGRVGPVVLNSDDMGA